MRAAIPSSLLAGGRRPLCWLIGPISKDLYRD